MNMVRVARLYFEKRKVHGALSAVKVASSSNPKGTPLGHIDENLLSLLYSTLFCTSVILYE